MNTTFSQRKKGEGNFVRGERHVGEEKKNIVKVKNKNILSCEKNGEQVEKENEIKFSFVSGRQRQQVNVVSEEGTEKEKRKTTSIS